MSKPRGATQSILTANVSSFLLIFIVSASNAALLSVNPQLVIPGGLSSIGVTSNATNIFVNITGAGNLNQAQQQLLIASLLGGLNSGLGAPGGAGGLGYQYGLNVGDYLGITGPAAAAAAAYTNPLGIYPPSASSGSYLPLQSLGSGLYPGYSNLVAGAPPFLGGGGGLGGYGSSPYGSGGGSALGAYLQSRPISSVFLPT